MEGYITDIMGDYKSDVGGGGYGGGDVTDIMGNYKYDMRNIPDIRGDLSKRPLLPCFEQCVESLSNILW